MHCTLGTIHQLHVSEIVILALMIEVMAFWRQVAEAIIALLVAAVSVGPAFAGGLDDSSARLL